MKKIEELDVFKLSHSLALENFELTKTFPEEEKYTHFMSGYERVSQMLTQLAKSLTRC
jgi:hypothetical protein